MDKRTNPSTDPQTDGPTGIMDHWRSVDPKKLTNNNIENDDVKQYQNLKIVIY